jgi:aryl-alcohol dehydrogenase-like predicted oxidoreductase
LLILSEIKKMERRRLGKTGLDVSPFSIWRKCIWMDRRRQWNLLGYWMPWVDEGFNFIDTADSYSNWVAGNKGGEL